VLLLVTVVTCATNPAWSAAEPQNVLLIVIDDIGLDWLDLKDPDTGASGPYGDVPGIKARTPQLATLAQQGVTFTNAWSSPRCSPTRATIMTGRYGVRTGVTGLVHGHNDNGLRLGETTIPQALGNVPGLRAKTAAFGKWHLSNCVNGREFHPNLAGFSYFAGTLGNIEQPEHGFYWTKYVNGEPETVGEPDQALNDAYHTTVTTDDARTWINGQSEPWFAYVAYHAAHWPFQIPPHDLVDPGDPPTHPAGYIDSPEESVRYMIEALDTEIGNLWLSLSEETRANTTIIVIGDNGSAEYTNPDSPYGGRQKGTLNQGGINVPLIIGGSGVDPSAYGVSDAMVHATDIFATAVELVSGVAIQPAPPPGLELDSVSVVPILQGAASSVHEYGFVPRNKLYGAIRNSQYKLIRTKTSEEFYDLDADEWEKINLLPDGLGELQSIYDELSAEFDAKLSWAQDDCPFAVACEDCCTDVFAVPGSPWDQVCLSPSPEPVLGLFQTCSETETCSSEVLTNDGTPMTSCEIRTGRYLMCPAGQNVYLRTCECEGPEGHCFRPDDDEPRKSTEVLCLPAGS
jgi:arylsulfatase A-like enzyme